MNNSQKSAGLLSKETRLQDLANIDADHSPRKKGKITETTTLSVLQNKNIRDSGLEYIGNNKDLDRNKNRTSLSMTPSEIPETCLQNKKPISDNKIEESKSCSQLMGDNSNLKIEPVFSGSDRGTCHIKRRLGIEDALKAVLDTDSNPDFPGESSEGEAITSDTELSTLVEVQNSSKNRKLNSTKQKSTFCKSKRGLSDSNSEDSQMICLSDRRRKTSEPPVDSDAESGSGYSHLLSRKKKRLLIESSSDCESSEGPNDRTLTPNMPCSDDSDEHCQTVKYKHARRSLALKNKNSVVSSGSDSGMDSPTKLRENISDEENKSDGMPSPCSSTRAEVGRAIASDGDSDRNVGISKKRKQRSDSSSEDESVRKLKVRNKTKQPRKKSRPNTNRERVLIRGKSQCQTTMIMVQIQGYV